MHKLCRTNCVGPTQTSDAAGMRLGIHFITYDSELPRQMSAGSCFRNAGVILLEQLLSPYRKKDQPAPVELMSHMGDGSKAKKRLSRSGHNYFVARLCYGIRSPKVSKDQFPPQLVRQHPIRYSVAFTCKRAVVT